MLLIPPIRSLLISYLQLRFEKYRAGTTQHQRPHPTNTNNDIIDVE
jgi:hypothetical protein